MPAGILPQRFRRRSPPWYLATAAHGGLRSAHDCRPRRALLHHSHSWAPLIRRRRFRVTRPRADMGRIEIPRRSSLLLSADVLSSCRKHGRHQAVKRRELITMLGGAAAAWPLAAHAQQSGKIARIGIVSVGVTSSDMVGPKPNHPATQAFLRGLHELGYVYGEH